MKQFIWHAYPSGRVMMFEDFETQPQFGMCYYKAKYNADELSLLLRLMKPVMGEIPSHVFEAYEAMDRAGSDGVEAYIKMNKAREKSGVHLRDIDGFENRNSEANEWVRCLTVSHYMETAFDVSLGCPEVISLHEKECGCKFYENGKSIFTNGQT